MVTSDNAQDFWQLRLAAATIADDETRQLYLNAIAEVVRRVSSGRSLAPAAMDRERLVIPDDDADIVC
jgi:hypothetical protein